MDEKSRYFQGLKDKLDSLEVQLKSFQQLLKQTGAEIAKEAFKGGTDFGHTQAKEKPQTTKGDAIAQAEEGIKSVIDE